MTSIVRIAPDVCRVAFRMAKTSLLGGVPCVAKSSLLLRIACRAGCLVEGQL